MFRNVVFAMAAAAAISAPASAVTALSFAFGSGVAATTNVASLARTTGGLTLTATARQFTAFPASLTSLSQTTATGQIQRSLSGIGINGGASNPQMDTNFPGAREAILISGSSDFSLRGLRLSFIDNDDTLQVYGVRADGSLVNLGYPGVVRRGLTGGNAGLSLLAGQATGTDFNAGLNGGTQSLTLVNPTTYFTRYLFTSRERGDAAYLGTLGQGYRLDSLTVGVPEPASWAMLIAGFGLVGAAKRRRRITAAA
ncbi:PEPxxWA-CTERM sorting domain-containing protein [Sandarakinorhabdus sp.]|uniref:PEPxxWA-CTERM sorting domain-containing protein n=1 Tax=Sandarakinorhabdus sp. TaxID=1916663 RepID=UPI00286E9CCB|nr:PEPxxWA-CTERM sorting domain-containing protein [Sandarakinorhabdus sp.]